MMKPNEEFPAPFSLWKHRISYGETDAMGVGYYAHYLHWFEQARSHLIRDRGMSYLDVERKGIFLPVRDASCRYIKSCRFDDEITVQVGISEWGRASMVFSYRIFLGGLGESISAIGLTKHACIDTNGKPTAVPDWLKGLFAV